MILLRVMITATTIITIVMANLLIETKTMSKIPLTVTDGVVATSVFPRSVCYPAKLAPTSSFWDWIQTLPKRMCVLTSYYRPSYLLPR